MSCGRPRAPTALIHVARGGSRTLLFSVRADAASGEMAATIVGLDQTLAVGSPVDLTGAKVWFTVKNRVEDVATLVAKRNAAAGGVDNQVLVIVPQTGMVVGYFRVSIDTADTTLLDPAASYWCDAFVQMPGGPPINRQQVVKNRQLVVDPAVTTNFF